MTRPRIPYPTKAQIQRLIEAARAAGIEIGALRITTTGQVTIVDKSAIDTVYEDDDLDEYV